MLVQKETAYRYVRCWLWQFALVCGCAGQFGWILTVPDVVTGEQLGSGYEVVLRVHAGSQREAGGGENHC